MGKVKFDPQKYRPIVHKGHPDINQDSVAYQEYWAKEIESRGASEIMITSINHEGRGNGFDLELINILPVHLLEFLLEGTLPFINTCISKLRCH